MNNRLPALVAILVGCQPDLDDPASRLTEARVLTVRAEPAEAEPGARVSYEALVVGADGARAVAPLTWAFCLERKSLAELGPVSPRCLGVDASALAPFGTGSSASGVLPTDACRRFGPEVPPGAPGIAPGRPTDPDETGGFYQPVRLGLATTTTLERTRIACGLANASQETLADFRRRYRANVNPRVASVLAVRGLAEERLTLDDDATEAPPVDEVAAGERLTFRVTWPACPAATCPGAEPYVAYDPAAGALIDRVESIQASWFATDGSFASDRTGADAFANRSANDWQAPSRAGIVRLYVVLRDDRGGSGWAHLRLAVVPR